jgi:HK97 family phage major capsid protein
MSIQALRERLAASNKAANHLLVEKGSQTWSVEDQKKFDEIADEGERLQRQIEAHEKMIAKDREANFTDRDDHRSDGEKKPEAMRGFEAFLRTKIGDMNAEQLPTRVLKPTRQRRTAKN